jgi:hypothetical protein
MSLVAVIGDTIMRRSKEDIPPMAFKKIFAARDRHVLPAWIWAIDNSVAAS